MALRPIRGEPGRFFDEATAKEYSIMDMREDSKYDTVKLPLHLPPPWWQKVRAMASLHARDIGRGEPISAAQGALYLAHIEQLCVELESYRGDLDNLRARESNLWAARDEFARTIERLEQQLAKRRARKTRRKKR